MKTKILFFACIALSNVGFSQTPSLILSGGWSTVNAESSSLSINGYKLGAQVEVASEGGHWAKGVAINYFHFQQPGSGLIGSNFSTKYATFPISLYGKYLVGKNKLQGYAKASAGGQFSTRKVETSTPLTDHDFGFAFGTGAGAYYKISDEVFLNLDYEFLYLTHGYYDHGTLNSVSLGIGFKLH